MMRITQSDTTFLTSNAIARSVLEYCVALRAADIAGSARLPAISRAGEPYTARVTFDHGRPVMATSEESELPEPPDSAAVRHMERVTRALRRAESA